MFDGQYIEKYFKPFQWPLKIYLYLSMAYINVCGMMILKMFFIKIHDIVQYFINISFILVNLFQ